MTLPSKSRWWLVALTSGPGKRPLCPPGKTAAWSGERSAHPDCSVWLLNFGVSVSKWVVSFSRSRHDCMLTRATCGGAGKFPRWRVSERVGRPSAFTPLRRRPRASPAPQIGDRACAQWVRSLIPAPTFHQQPEMNYLPYFQIDEFP